MRRYRPRLTRSKRPKALPPEASASLTEDFATDESRTCSTAVWMSWLRIGCSLPARTRTMASLTVPGRRGRAGRPSAAVTARLGGLVAALGLHRRAVAHELGQRRRDRRPTDAGLSGDVASGLGLSGDGLEDEPAVLAARCAPRARARGATSRAPI